MGDATGGPVDEAPLRHEVTEEQVDILAELVSLTEGICTQVSTDVGAVVLAELIQTHKNNKAERLQQEYQVQLNAAQQKLAGGVQNQGYAAVPAGYYGNRL